MKIHPIDQSLMQIIFRLIENYESHNVIIIHKHDQIVNFVHKKYYRISYFTM